MKLRPMAWTGCVLALAFATGCTSGRSHEKSGQERGERAEQDRHADRDHADEADEEDEDDDGEVVEMARVPAVAITAFRDVAGSAAAKRVLREQEDGMTIFEFEFERNGLPCSVKATEAGTVLEVEEGVSPTNLPHQVSEAIRRKYPHGTVRAAESVRTYEFECTVLVDGKAVNVTVLPNGEFEDGD